jgi:predicted ATPase
MDLRNGGRRVRSHWAGRAEQGRLEEGIAQMQQGLAAWQATGSKVWRPTFLALLAEAWAKVRQIEDGLIALAEALAAVDNTGERFHKAEQYRLKVELLLQQMGSPTAITEAETCFQHALAVACRQQATAPELRAATSLGRLWRQQGKDAQAYQLLADVYGWFTEGFDTTDLQEAKTLLSTSRRRRPSYVWHSPDIAQGSLDSAVNRAYF